MILTAEQATAIVLWTAHTHVLEAFDCTPYLSVTSPVKRSGKTRLFECLEPLVCRPWLTGRVSAAVLVRKTDAEHPTLLLDESDTALKVESEYSEALRGLLNTGYRRSGKASLCVGQGANLTYRDFSTYGAKAIAGIGKIPDTVADRAIPIVLKRRARTEPVQRWRARDAAAEAASLRAALVAWAPTARDALRAARPLLPDLLGDRQADVWEPLLEIADLAGDSCRRRRGKRRPSWPRSAPSRTSSLDSSSSRTSDRFSAPRSIRPSCIPRRCWRACTGSRIGPGIASGGPKSRSAASRWRTCSVPSASWPPAISGSRCGWARAIGAPPSWTRGNAT